MTKFILLALLLSGCTQNYLEINNHKIVVEIADTEEKRAKGLSGRENLCDNCGMLFIFDKAGKYNFWMKDMQFPLDFIFINGDEVADVKQNISPDTYPEIISSNQVFDKVLEVNAKYIEKNNITIGQKISRNGFPWEKVIKY